MSNTLKSIPIGKLLRAENSQFVAGCRVKSWKRRLLAPWSKSAWRITPIFTD